MAVSMHIFYYLVFQAILRAASGFILPPNLGKLQTDALNIESENLQFSEDTPQNMNNICNSIETYKSFPKFVNVAVPNIDNSFKLVLSYGEECAMKYKQFGKLQSFQATESIARFLLPTFVESFSPTYEIAKPPFELPTVVESCFPISEISKPPVLLPTVVESCFPINEVSQPPVLLPTVVESCLPVYEIAQPITPLSSFVAPNSGFRLPLQVASSVTALDPLFCKTTDSIIPMCSSLTPSCFDTSPAIYYSEPLTLPCSSNVELLKSVEILKLLSPAVEFLNLPVSAMPGPALLPSITTLVDPNVNIITPLSPRSTFTLPLSVTSTTKDIKPSILFDNWSLNVNVPPCTHIPLTTMSNGELFVPTPNALPHPSIPALSVNSDEINPATFSLPIDNSIPDITSRYQYLCPHLIDSEPALYNCPIVPSAQKLPVCVSYRGFYQGSTDIPSLGTVLSSPLYRNCHTLKPLQLCTNTLTSASSQPYSLPVSEFNSCLSSTLSNTASLSIDNTLAANYITSQIFDDNCVSSSINSLSSVLLPPASSLMHVSNCMTSPNEPLLQSNPLLFDDFTNSISESFCNSCKRSPNAFEIPESGDSIHTHYMNTENITAEPSINNTGIDSDESYSKNLQQLITVVEMLIDDKVDKSNLNDVLSLLTDF